MKPDTITSANEVTKNPVFIFFSLSSMKKYGIIIGITATAVIAILAFALVPTAHSERIDIPEEAWDMARMIQAKSVKHGEAQKELQPILDQIAKLEGQRDAKLADMGKLAGGAGGLDHSLCAEYGLKYVRGEGDKLGRFERVTADCPLE